MNDVSICENDSSCLVDNEASCLSRFLVIGVYFVLYVYVKVYVWFIRKSIKRSKGGYIVVLPKVLTAMSLIEMIAGMIRFSVLSH
jgi:hypothetical protein